jgi:hypothetical protein
MDFDLDLGWDDLGALDVISLLVPFDGTFEFDTTTNIARFNKKVVDASKIDDARLHVDPTIRSRNLALVFGIRGDLRLILPLRKGEKDVVREDVRVGVIAMLEKSQVAIPNNDPYDPTGKFARSGSPTNVTREEAIALVRNPPLPGAKLPIFI